MALRDVCQYFLEHKRKIRLVDDNLSVLFNGLGPLSGVTSCMKNLYRMCLTPPEEPSHLLPKYPSKLIIETPSLSKRDKNQTVTLFEGRHEYLIRAFLADICVLVFGAYDVLEQNIDVNKIIGICHMMSSRDLIIVINLDSTSKFAEKVFTEKRNFLSEKLNKAVGPCFEVIPVDAIRGTNLTRTSAKFDWFKGDSLFSLLRASQNQTNYDEKLVEKLRKSNLQITLYDNLRKDGTRVFLGKLISGTVRRQDDILLFQYSLSATITSLRIQNKDVEYAVAGDNIGFKINAKRLWWEGRRMERNFETVIHDKYEHLSYTVAFRAKFVVLDNPKLDLYRTYKVYYGGLRILARVIYIFPQKKYQDRRDAGKLKVFSGILWPFSRIGIQPFKPSEFQKNYNGKVLLAENHSPIAVGRVDKVLNRKIKRSSLADSKYWPYTDEHEALTNNAKKLLFDPSEEHLVPKFLEVVTHEYHEWNLFYRR